MFRIIEKLADIIEKILIFWGIVCFIGLLGVVILQVITRLWIPWTISWTEEVSRFLFLFCVSFLAPVVLKSRELIFVDLLTIHFSAKVQTFLLIGSDIAITILSGIVVPTAFVFASLGIGQISPALELPMWISYSSMCILFVFITFFGIVNIIRHRDIFMNQLREK